jgi:putative transposase
LAILRYVERNPVQAKLVEEADTWRCSSLWHRVNGNQAGLLDDGPLVLPRRWLHRVQLPQAEAELVALQRSVTRGTPFVDASWQERTAQRLDLQSTLRPRGRPRKSERISS